ncbi:peptide deformylase [candidate division WOR-1 bacterium DG_54_3]|uniref:Peptide deformylase n=1 Tax=candidate division WOR-1 bacterium DG_54_3 TaxID=1703775 RepID=A0A0S7Y2L8_UNCSA|nr:MAG: peptide deformylase [candidate division WOR-1 bacterium DG_54_3]
MIRKILRFPNPLLRKKCKAVGKVTSGIIRLIEDMIETMQAAPGVGLAAPQIGELVRVIVADIGEGPIALINPKILEKSGKQTFTEGCLCLPGVEAPVERASQVLVRGVDRVGKKVKIEARGLLATIFQHEVDHLDGLVFIDRVKDPSLIKYVPPEKEKKEELI